MNCEKLFGTITTNARRMGMKVNPEKTRLLCVSSAIHSNVSVHIRTDHSRIESEDSLVMLGFRFGSRPTIAEHLVHLRQKFNVRSWMI